MISYKCSECKASLESPEDMGGKMDKCPNCETVVYVPLTKEQKKEEKKKQPQKIRTTIKTFFSQPSMIVSGIALVFAVFALVIALFFSGDIPGKGIDAYDFSTPQKATRSMMEIHANADLKAQLELDVARASEKKDKFRECLDTFHVERTLEHNGKVIVLYRYKEGGLDRFQSRWFEKQGDMFFSTYVSTFDWKDGDKGKIKKSSQNGKQRLTLDIHTDPAPPIYSFMAIPRG